MAGIKGKSGRKNKFQEDTKFRVIDMAWSVIEGRLTDVNIDEKTRTTIALEIVKRSCPQVIEHTGIPQKEDRIIVIHGTGTAKETIQRSQDISDRQAARGVQIVNQ